MTKRHPFDALGRWRIVWAVILLGGQHVEIAIVIHIEQSQTVAATQAGVNCMHTARLSNFPFLCLIDSMF